jgi:nucleoside-diphosphate-sugar epimerase
MRVVVTGATGMVGASVVPALAARPEVTEVVGLARRVPEGEPPPKVRYAEADVRGDDLGPHVAGAGAVVNLAWMIHPAWSASATWAANVGGGERVLRAAAEAGVGCIVHASSLGAYAPGPEDDDRLVDESWPTAGIPSLPYAREKAAMEGLCARLAADRPQTRVVTLRPSFVVHERNAARIRRVMLGPLVPRWATSRLLVALPHVAELRGQAAHADDVAEAFATAVVGDARGAFNLVDETVHRATTVAELLGAMPVPTPFLVARAAASAAFHARAQPTHPGWLDLLRRAPLLSSARARRELGWEVRTPSREAIAQLLRGLRDRADGDTPPLDDGGRRHEVAGGVGADPR